MTINSSSLAFGVGTSVNNVAFGQDAQAIPRKIMIFGLVDDALNVVEQVYRLNSPEHAASLFGDGFGLHRQAIAAFAGSGGIETYAFPLYQPGAGVQATGTITIGSVTNLAGNIYLYVNGERVVVGVAAGQTAAVIAQDIVDELGKPDWKHLPFTFVVNGVTPEQIDFTSKDETTYTNLYDIRLNRDAENESLPSGVTAVIVDPAGGAGALDQPNKILQRCFGLGDTANSLGITEIIHPWTDNSELAEISEFNGVGDQNIGLWEKIVARPFRTIIADNYDDVDQLSHFTTIADNHKTDRTNGLIALPQALTHINELSAEIVGIMARVNHSVPAAHYQGIPLTHAVGPGVNQLEESWVNYYTQRDSAVRGGVSTTIYSGGQYILQNVITFYRPDSVSPSNNAYRAQSNISKLQTIQRNHAARFKDPKWQGFFIVSAKENVSSLVDRQKARDVRDVYAELFDLAKDYAGLGLLYESAYTIDRIANEGLVQVRQAGNGFDTIFPCILSGEGGIFDNRVQVDINLSTVL